MNTCAIGDCREILRSLDPGIFRTCVTSPPYFGLRDYGVEGQLGLEATPDEYVAVMVDVFREVRRVLTDDGTLWLNLGDGYASNAGGYDDTGSRGATSSKRIGAGTMAAVVHDRVRKPPTGLKPKDLVGIPWMVAFALRADGWYLRSDIIWAKPNPMPESVTDRPTKAHEYLFLLSKSERYFYDADAIREAGTGVPWNSARSTLAANGVKNVALNKSGQRITAGADTHPDDVDRTGRNRRTVWTIPTEPYPGSHFATFPTALVTPCILAGSRYGDAVLDPFLGSGTVGMVAESLGRRWFGCELNPKYGELIKQRTSQSGLRFAT